MFHFQTFFLQCNLDQGGNLLCPPNTIKHCSVTKHFPRGHQWPCLIVFDKILKYSTKHLIKQTVKHFFIWMVSDQIFLLLFGHSVRHVWSPNNVWSWLVTRHFLFGQNVKFQMKWRRQPEFYDSCLAVAAFKLFSSADFPHRHWSCWSWHEVSSWLAMWWLNHNQMRLAITIWVVENIIIKLVPENFIG